MARPSNVRGQRLLVGSPRVGWQQFLLNSLLALGGVLAAVIALELALRLHAALNPGSNDGAAEPTVSIQKPDSTLGWRLVPQNPGHDQRGYRNASALTSADIVAIGDSQVYGVNVIREDAWPQQLERIGHLTVYNMGVPGYGPAQYYTVSRTDLRQIRTRTVVVEVYTGNDFLDVVQAVYSFDTDTYLGFRNPTVSADTYMSRWRTITGLWQAQLDSRSKYKADEYAKRGVSGLEHFLQDHTKLYWWLADRRVISPPSPDLPEILRLASRQWARDNPKDGLVYERDGVQTVLRTSFHVMATDPSDPAVAEGLHLTKLLLHQMAQDMAQQGINLLIAIMPTKELVFAQAVEQTGTRDPILEELSRYELSDTNELLHFCVDEKLHCAYLMGPLRMALQTNMAIYPSDVDDHPTAAGHTIIARALLETLENLGWVPTH